MIRVAVVDDHHALAEWRPEAADAVVHAALACPRSGPSFMAAEPAAGSAPS
jgi:hypothetical protein